MSLRSSVLAVGVVAVRSPARTMAAIKSCFRGLWPTGPMQPSSLIRAMNKRSSCIDQLTSTSAKMRCLIADVSHSAAMSAINSNFRLLRIGVAGNTDRLSASNVFLPTRRQHLLCDTLRNRHGMGLDAVRVALAGSRRDVDGVSLSISRHSATLFNFLRSARADLIDREKRSVTLRQLVPRRLVLLLMHHASRHSS